jgi:hypothetical protein
MTAPNGSQPAPAPPVFRWTIALDPATGTWSIVGPPPNGQTGPLWDLLVAELTRVRARAWAEQQPRPSGIVVPA